MQRLDWETYGSPRPSALLHLTPSQPPSDPPSLSSRGVTLGYADLKKLIIETVDKVPDGADKVITGGRLNVTAAMLALEAMLNARGAQPAGGQPALSPAEEGAGGSPQEPAVVSPTPDGSESPPPPLPVPSPAAPPGKVCGGSPLAGLNSASQSSTSGASKANFAIDGNCVKRRVTQGSCSQTRECDMRSCWSGHVEWLAGADLGPCCSVLLCGRLPLW